MFMNDVLKKEEVRTEIQQELKTLGVTSRPKKPKQQNVKSKGNVFNVPLEALPKKRVTLKTGQQIPVPKVVDHLCSLILTQVDTEGIFRKEIPKNRINELKAILEKGSDLNKLEPVIDVAVILKILFRELPEPLIPFGHHDLFLKCILLKSLENQMKSLLLACLLLPNEHLNTLIYLMQFFQEVSQHSIKNKMNPYNIAVCIGPTLFPIEGKTPAEIQSKTLKVNDIFKILIENAFHLGMVPSSVIQEMSATSKGPPKIKKRRSTSLSRMINGLKKIVGGKSDEKTHNVVTPDLLLTPVSTATKKRKSQANGISNRKKKELLNKLPDNVLLSTPFTPCRTPVSMDLSGTHQMNLMDSADLLKEKKSQWFLRSKSVKNLKSEEATLKNNYKSGLERRWSAITQPSNIKRTKKRNSFAASTLSRKETHSNKNREKSPEPDYIRVSKEEYEAIKNRVSAMERRISMELESVQSLIKTDNENNTNQEVDNNVKNVQTVYEQTLVQADKLSPTTDQLAKRLSRELKIRRSADQKIIRSPSARKIGSMRRKSKEFEKNNSRVSRHQSWHAPQNDAIPRVSLKRGRPNTVQTGLPRNRAEEVPENKEIKRTRSSSVGDGSIKKISCNLSGSSCDTWVSAEGFFATLSSTNDSSSLSGRASLAKLRSQNAGMVLAKAKLFDQLKDSDSSGSSSLVRSIPRVKVGNKIGSTRNPDSRLSCRVKNLKYEEKRIGKKSMSPRRRNGCLNQKQKLQMAKHYLDSSTEKNSDKENIPEKCNSIEKKPLKDYNRIESPKYYTPKSVPPHIKKQLNMRSPKRLCRTPVGIDRSTPLKVLKTPLHNHL